MLLEKAEEYSRNEDRLWNFRRGTLWDALICDRPDAFNRAHPIKTCWEYLGKHVVSVSDMAVDAMNGERVDHRLISAKFNDFHNYLHLLEALIREQE